MTKPKYAAAKARQALNRVGRAADVDMDTMRQEFLEAFGGERGLAGYAKEIYDDPDTAPQTRARVLEFVMQMFIKTGGDAASDIGSMSTEDLDEIIESVDEDDAP